MELGVFALSGDAGSIAEVFLVAGKIERTAADRDSPAEIVETVLEIDRLICVRRDHEIPAAADFVIPMHCLSVEIDRSRAVRNKMQHPGAETVFNRFAFIHRCVERPAVVNSDRPGEAGVLTGEFNRCRTRYGRIDAADCQHAAVAGFVVNKVAREIDRSTFTVRILIRYFKGVLLADYNLVAQTVHFRNEAGKRVIRIEDDRTCEVLVRAADFGIARDHEERIVAARERVVAVGVEIADRLLERAEVNVRARVNAQRRCAAKRIVSRECDRSTRLHPGATGVTVVIR